MNVTVSNGEMKPMIFWLQYLQPSAVNHFTTLLRSPLQDILPWSTHDGPESDLCFLWQHSS